MSEDAQVTDGHAGALPAPGSAAAELDGIMRDMGAAYAAIRKAAYPSLDSAEHKALDAVYLRLRAWNERQGARR